MATNVSPRFTPSAAAWRRPPSAKSSKNSTDLMSAKSPPVMIDAARSASARSAGESSAARRWKKSRHIDSSRMERRPVAPQPEKTMRPSGERRASTIAPTSESNSFDANTCRIVMGIWRSPRWRHWTPATTERLKSSSSVAVIGLDCSVGRKPRWNCFSSSMNRRAASLAAAEHSKPEADIAAIVAAAAVKTEKAENLRLSAAFELKFIYRPSRTAYQRDSRRGPRSP